MKIIFVTGGAGFMGSHFIRHILEKYPRYQVVNFDKLTYAGNLANLRDVEERFPGRYQFVRGDIADRRAVDASVRKSDVIVNFAAETHVDRSLGDIRPFVHTQIVGVHTLLESARAFLIKRFLHISTDEVYGSIRRGRWAEDDPVHPANPYAVSKASSDLLVRAYHRTWNLPVIITRATNNFGPNQYPEKAIPLFITNILEGKKIPLYGKGNQMREWLYVRDHAEAVDTVLHRGIIGEMYHIGSGRHVTNRALAETICALLGRDRSWIEYVPDRPGHDFRYALSTQKIRTLGWKPRYHFSDALNQTVLWYRNNRPWWRGIKSGAFRTYYRKNYVLRKTLFRPSII